jgi:hypothetical protein
MALSPQGQEAETLFNLAEAFSARKSSGFLMAMQFTENSTFYKFLLYEGARIKPAQAFGSAR